MAADSAAINCDLFFKKYAHPIDYSPYDKMPKHLKPMLDLILDEIEEDFELDQPINRHKVRVTSIIPIRVLELNLRKNLKFYVFEEDSQWRVYDEEYYENAFSGEEVELVYVPPQ